MVLSAQRLRRILSWPTAVPQDLHSVVRESLESAEPVLPSSRIVMLWEEVEEPWMHVSVLSRSEYSVTREAPGKFGSIVAPAVGEGALICRAPDFQRVRIRRGNELESILLDSGPVHAGLLERFPLFESIISVSLSGEAITGRIFFYDVEDLSDDDLLLAELMANLIVRRSDQVLRLRNAREDSVTEERLRVARDLHDGLLQSFTGVVLQLETIHQILQEEPEKARKGITEAQGVIMADQRELRNYVQQLRPRTLRTEMSYALPTSLTELRERYQRQWGIDVDFEVGDLDAGLSQSLGAEVFRIVAEGVANAAKHGQATKIAIDVRIEQGVLEITISDNGLGFPMPGRYDMHTMKETHQGPVSLTERVMSLGGQLVVESSERGARLEIALPLTWPGE